MMSNSAQHFIFLITSVSTTAFSRDDTNLDLQFGHLTISEGFDTAVIDSQLYRRREVIGKLSALVELSVLNGP